MNTMEIAKWGRYFALYDQEELVCVTVYKKGAQEVRRRIEELKSMVEIAKPWPTKETNQNQGT